MNNISESFDASPAFDMRESVEAVSDAQEAERTMLTMPLAIADESSIRGIPEIRDAILRGVLAVCTFASPEAALAAQERISIPKDHVRQFEQDTGINIEAIAKKYGVFVDHSMVSPGVNRWVIHIGQTHGQMDEDSIRPGTTAVIERSQTSTYGILDTLRNSGVDTVFEEAHTNSQGDAHKLIQEACTAIRKGEPMTRAEDLYEINGFFNTTVRRYLEGGSSASVATVDKDILTKLGGAMVLGCEGKIQVLPAEDNETNLAMQRGNLEVHGDRPEIMGPYKEALSEAISLGYKKTAASNLSDRKAILEYMEAVIAFLGADLNNAHFDMDPMATLLARLTDKDARAVFSEFNERFEKTKNKTVRFDRELAALTAVGVYGEANPTKSVIPLVYGALHNFVAALPAYNATHSIKYNYVRFNTQSNADLPHLKN